MTSLVSSSSCDVPSAPVPTADTPLLPFLGEPADEGVRHSLILLVLYAPPSPLPLAITGKFPIEALSFIIIFPIDALEGLGGKCEKSRVEPNCRRMLCAEGVGGVVDDGIVDVDGGGCRCCSVRTAKGGEEEREDEVDGVAALVGVGTLNDPPKSPNEGNRGTPVAR